MTVLRYGPAPLHPYLRIILLVAVANCVLTLLFYSQLVLYPLFISSELSFLNVKSTTRNFLESFLRKPEIPRGCVEGYQEVISPGHIVEFKCNRYRQGTTYEDVSSHNDCAALCESLAIDICSYHPPTKRCVVSSLYGNDIPRQGVYYMIKVDAGNIQHEESEEDPFEDAFEDPFYESLTEERDNCLYREVELRAELDRCRSEIVMSSPLCGVQGIALHGRIDMIKVSGVETCKSICLANPLCQAYSASDDPGDWCYIFDRPHGGLTTSYYRHLHTYDRDC
ncbi:hypothetical protein F53441_5501 [Fusarium austroafricanum]|uniref:Apple domain-containing protein n=1 Tax=Fusarium austroafricanum TaxID=2364996 RepID=A0A8H4NUB8_9HYPO|nr:hypothetical protein F53441_5501 [Fusarium austroafricanum]